MLDGDRYPVYSIDDDFSAPEFPEHNDTNSEDSGDISEGSVDDSYKNTTAGSTH